MLLRAGMDASSMASRHSACQLRLRGAATYVRLPRRFAFTLRGGISRAALLRIRYIAKG